MQSTFRWGLRLRFLKDFINEFDMVSRTSLTARLLIKVEDRLGLFPCHDPQQAWLDAGQIVPTH